MSKRIGLFIIVLAIMAQLAFATPTAKIISLSGEVKIRHGVEETWHPAAVGMMLKEIDTILTGEASAVVLETADGATFRLGSYAILDIADLRKITEREMFLFLMSQKVNQIPSRSEKTGLRIGNVSVIHGASQAESSRKTTGDHEQSWLQESNGAKALYEQQYYPNAVVKLHKILAKYPDIFDCGEIHFYLGKAFEALNKNGQASDAYKMALNRLCDDEASKQYENEARQAIERLK